MSNRGQVILATLGTDGDVYPFLALGVELRARGYQATLATNESFADRARSAGLEFCPLVSIPEFEEVLNQPAFWHPIQGPAMMARWGARLLRRQYEVLSGLAAAQPAILVASPGVLTARFVQEKLGVPLVSVVLQPWMLPSVFAPPVMMGGVSLPQWSPRPVVKIYFRLLDEIGAWLMGPELKRLRASLGLRPVRRMFQWWLSPELVVGLFPGWFGEPQPDWPGQVRLAGFPLHDGQADSGVPADTLEFCRAGSPPVAFTFGTGMRHAAGLFQTAIEACRGLGARAIFLTKFRGQLPRELPPFAHHCEFAPFQKLFPLCSGVVHHGGVGTVAKALAAGTPQLIVPFAYDQLDNALRVKRLGTGDWLTRGRRHAGGMAVALEKTIHAQVAVQARTIASRCQAPSGIQCAADLIDDIRAKRNTAER